MDNEISLVFDVDGTLCPIKKSDEKYEDLVPNSKIVEKLREYKKNGAKIILFTSRNMKTYKGNIGMINANTSIIMQEWLKKWDIPYDEIYFGKPWPGHRGLYIDDRTVRPDEFLSKSFEELENMCKESSVK